MSSDLKGKGHQYCEDPPNKAEKTWVRTFMSAGRISCLPVQQKLKQEEMHLTHNRKTIAKTDAYLADTVLMIYSSWSI